MKNTAPSRAAEFLLRRPLLPMLALLPGLAIVGIFLPKLAFDPGVESFMDRTGTTQKHLDEVQEKFISDSWLLISYSAADVFSKEALEASRKLAEEIRSVRVPRETVLAFKPVELAEAVMNGLDVPTEGEMIAPVQDVQALVTMQDAYGGDGMFKNDLLVPEVLDGGKEQLEAIRVRARKNPLFRDHLLGKDDTWAAIYVRLDHRLNVREEARTVAAIRAKIEAAKGKGIDELHMSGWPDLQWGMTSMTMRDTLVLSPVMMGVAVMMLFFFLRRLLGAALVMVIVNVLSPFALASIPLAGATFHPLFSTLMPVLTVVCVATSLHFFVEAGRARALGASDEEAKRSTLSALLAPTLMSVTTTAIGFLALASSDIEAIQQYGVVMFISLLPVAPVTLVCIAAAWSRFGVDRFVSPKGAAVSSGMNAALDRLADLAIKRSGAVIVACVLAFGVLGYGLSIMKVGESQIDYFPETHPTRIGATTFQEQFGGVIPFLISIRTDDRERFHDPAELKKLEELQRFLKEETPVDRVLGIVDLLKIMHRAFFDENDEYAKLPDSREAVSQLLLLNTAERVWHYVDEHDRQWVRIYARMPVWNGGEQNQVFEKIRGYLATHFPESAGYHAHVVGDSVIVAESSNKVAKTVGLSFGISLLIVMVLIAIGFRSVTAAFFSLPANLFPILVAFALIGYLDIGLSVTTATIAAIVVGIAVDDTIHLMHDYRRELGEGASVDDAIRNALRKKGPAIMSTSIIFALGFSVFVLAEFNGMQTMGAFLAIAMVAALAGDLVLLPAMLRASKARLGAPKRPS